MFTTSRRLASGKALGLLAVALLAAGLVAPGAAGIGGTSGDSSGSARSDGGNPGDRVLRTVVRVERSFTVRPHSLATNEIVRCPARTKLTGGGTSLVGQPNSPRNAPIVYTNGPVGNILPGEQQSWGSEVANRSGQAFEYVQFALCATTRRIPFGN
jgi:hypothetical protein